MKIPYFNQLAFVGIIMSVGCFSFPDSQLFSQNIFDSYHTKIYANHLYSSENYIEAAQEYERLAEFSPCDSFNLNRFFSSMIRSGNYEKGILKFEKLNCDDLIENDKRLIKMYLFMLLQEDEYKKVNFIICDTLSEKKQELYDFYVSYYLLKGDIDSAKVLLASTTYLQQNDSVKQADYLNMIEKIEGSEMKNPVLASILSVFIPGSGKAYSDDFMNGAFIFSITVLNAWQAYRAFKKPSGKHIYGILFGTAAVIFYVGNIYGSYTSAQRTNAFKNKKLKQKILEFLYDENEF